jgi:hypothetical protein
MVFENGEVSLTTDLIFGVCVLAEHGWHPVDQLSKEEVQHVLALLDYNPTCPPEFYEALRTRLERAPDQ